jgi:putative cell wall-binding protein
MSMQKITTQSQDKTSKNFDGIEDALDVDTDIVTEVKPDIEVKVEEVATSTRDQLKKDYEYTRGNLYSLIEKGQEAVDGILELAQESDQPRAFEVAGQLIKHVGDVADKLVDLQKKVADIENPKGSTKEVNTTNNTMFVGSTADLAKFLKQQQDK